MKLSSQMAIRLTPETRKTLREEAERQQRKPSDLVRLWIVEKLNRAAFLRLNEDCLLTKEIEV